VSPAVAGSTATSYDAFSIQAAAESMSRRSSWVRAIGARANVFRIGFSFRALSTVQTFNFIAFRVDFQATTTSKYSSSEKVVTTAFCPLRLRGLCV